jgi:hypothetical protein
MSTEQTHIPENSRRSHSEPALNLALSAQVRALDEEFEGAVPKGQLRERLDDAAEDLLESAHVTQFVPLLAAKRVRNELDPPHAASDERPSTRAG